MLSKKDETMDFGEQLAVCAIVDVATNILKPNAGH